MADYLTEVKDKILAIPADKFKMMFLTWWAESEHQGWDGFTSAEEKSFQCFMHDFGMYGETATPEDLVGFFTFGSHSNVDASGNGDINGK